MEHKNKNGVFFGGVPTGPDVQLLMDAMPKWAWNQGDIATYSLIEESASLKRGSNRFRTVVAAWRKRLLREMNVDTEAIPNQGIKWLAEGERLRAGVRDHGRHTKGQGRALHRVSRTRVELLSPEDQKRSEHARRIMEASWAAARTDAKEIAMQFQPVKALPRTIPKEAADSK